MTETADDPAGAPTGAAQYEVGYCRPPLATRFRPEQSGNPRGRPKGARNLRTVVAAAAREHVEIKENDRPRRITKLEAAVKQLVNRAAMGEERATRFFLDLLDAHESRPAPPEAEPLGEDDAAVIADLVRRIRASSP
jgi:Family of unknown function (DUF5681)